MIDEEALKCHKHFSLNGSIMFELNESEPRHANKSSSDLEFRAFMPSAHTSLAKYYAKEADRENHKPQQSFAERDSQTRLRNH